MRVAFASMQKSAAKACVIALLVAFGCGTDNKSATQDAGTLDAGTQDAGTQDAGTPDAGAAGKACDPLADNRFGTGAAGDPIAPKTGSACAANQGCYGTPSATAGQPTQFFCALEGNHSLVQRSTCDVANGCQPEANTDFVNGCAQGYLPLEFDPGNGALIQLCAALCQPQDCYAGHCGSDNLAAAGSGTHQCAASDVRTEPGGANNGNAYSFPTGANAGANSCYYWWQTEFDGAGVQHPSAFDNTLGLCLDHNHYFFDPSGGQSPTTPWPNCNTLPGSGSSGPGGTNASDWGCISTTTATALGDTSHLNGARSPVIHRPRLTGRGLQQLLQMSQGQ